MVGCFGFKTGAPNMLYKNLQAGFIDLVILDPQKKKTDKNPSNPLHFSKNR